jgi:signal recognition particle receptor subunit beta
MLNCGTVVFFNYTTMQMTAKIVYYGPGLCGKTTNLQAIHLRTAPQSRGEMVSLETETDRTLFFDLLPLEVGVIGGMKVRLQLYTVPGQVFYNATRKLVLKGVDGVVFVADSQKIALDANLESLSNLWANFTELGIASDQVPVVFQYNKRDIRNILPVDALQEALNPAGARHFEAAALHGVGVFETLKAISKMAITSIRKKLSGDEGRPAASPFAGARTSTPAPPASSAPPPPAPPPAATAASRGAVGSATPAASSSPVSAIEALVSSPDETSGVEFAQEDTNKHVVPVKTKGDVDIHRELEKLRTVTATAARAVPTPAGGHEVERRLKEMLSIDQGVRQAVKRKASIEVPSALLKLSPVVKVQLCFTNDHGEDIVHDTVAVPLGGNRRLEWLSLQLEIDVKGKG